MEGLAEATSAAAGAVTSALVLHPLDLAKTRTQPQLAAGDGAERYSTPTADKFTVPRYIQQQHWQ